MIYTLELFRSNGDYECKPIDQTGKGPLLTTPKKLPLGTPLEAGWLTPFGFGYSYRKRWFSKVTTTPKTLKSALPRTRGFQISPRKSGFRIAYLNSW